MAFVATRLANSIASDTLDRTAGLVAAEKSISVVPETTPSGSLSRLTGGRSATGPSWGAAMTAFSINAVGLAIMASFPSLILLGFDQERLACRRLSGRSALVEPGKLFRMCRAIGRNGQPGMPDRSTRPLGAKVHLDLAARKNLSGSDRSVRGLLGWEFHAFDNGNLAETAGPISKQIGPIRFHAVRLKREPGAALGEAFL